MNGFDRYPPFTASVGAAVPRTTAEAVQRLAIARGQPVSDVVRTALSEHLQAAGMNVPSPRLARTTYLHRAARVRVL